MKSYISRFSYFFYGLHSDILIATFSLLHWYSTQNNIEIPFNIYFLLLSTVWVIYCIDHLFDVTHFDVLQKIPSRYLFVKNNKKLVFILIGCITILNLYIVFSQLTQNQLLFGFILTFAVALYLVLNHKTKLQFFPKELIITLIFCFGILVASDIIFDKIVFFVLFGLVLSNVLIYSLLGITEDVQFGLTSSIKYVGEVKIKFFVLIILFVIISLSGIYIKNNFSILFISVFYFGIVWVNFFKKYVSFLKDYCDLFLVMLCF